MTEQQLDVRGLPKPDKHPAIFAAYAHLPVGGSFVLVNNHDPKHLRDEFDADYPGSHDWTYLQRGPKEWHILIGKRTATALPRVLVNTMRTAEAQDADATGAVWNIPVAQRDLDSNIVALAPGGGIDSHTGPDLDVLIYVLSGDGQLTTELETHLALAPGDLVWLPRRSQRKFSAGRNGLRYLTVHQRRKALVLQPPEPRSRP
ncbi:DUF2249 domain-containing protein [[Mycobacterium] burgundiense]|uniref:DUF2249 domain-containing protein n=1 Tax=[Mycobacterium] burgundiense TaxID=3064286 RepID=A0ABM9LFS6_9MYCO|nr:DUF2249 domain-containing protein [Mycolicibacterium sp. MU0053]CAJ1498266.1 DUF2249 domain-containing protein [Mycolicibacterium sp. MU0053]